MPQHQSVFRAARHHAIRLVCTLYHQVVNQNSDVSVAPFEHEGRFAFHIQSGVDSGNEPLRRRFFIAARSVELACEIQSLYAF